MESCQSLARGVTTPQLSMSESELRDGDLTQSSLQLEEEQEIKKISIFITFDLSLDRSRWAQRGIALTSSRIYGRTVQLW